MSLSIKSLLRTQRRLWGLTQKELAKLLGFKSYEQVSKLENTKREPNIKVAIGTYVIFGVDLQKMFPKLWGEVEEHVIRRLYTFYRVVENGTSKKSKRKRELAERALRRATRKGKKNDD